MKKILRATFLGITALVASVFAFPQNVEAESKTASIKASVEETLSLTLSANAMNFNLETSELYTDFINVTGRTNSAGGYTISFNANNDYNDLKNSNPAVTTSIASITTAASAADFPESAWGYSLDQEDYIFKKIPLAPKNIFTTAEAGESTNKFTTGIKGGASLVAGEYENELLFTIVANPILDADGYEPIVYDDKAKAIFTANNIMNLVYDDNDYLAGDSYNNDEIVAAYKMPINNHPTFNCDSYGCSVAWEYSLWDENITPNVTTVNISESFHNFKPTSTSYWFAKMNNLTTINGIENINTEQVKNASYMFQYTKLPSLDLSSWNISKLENADYMFQAISGDQNQDFILNVTGWNTGNLRTAKWMFEDIAWNTHQSFQILGIKEWDVSSLEDATNMFEYMAPYASSISLDLSDWDVSNVREAKYMFAKIGYSTDMLTLKFNNLDFRNAENMYGIAQYIGQGAHHVTIEMNNWKAQKVTDLSYAFQGAGYTADNDTTFNFSMKNFYAPSLETTDSMFLYAGWNAKTSNMDVSGWRIGNATNIKKTFHETAMYSNTVTLDASNWDIHSAENLEGMFYSCGYAALDFSLDISGWQDGNATNMRDMFRQVGEGYQNGYSAEGSFELIGVEALDTSKVTNMNNMFYGIAQYNMAAEVVLDLSNWDVSNVSDMGWMFGNVGTKSKVVSLDLSGWHLGNSVSNINYIFSGLAWGAQSTTIDLRGWTSGTALNFNAMLAGVGNAEASVTFLLPTD